MTNLIINLLSDEKRPGVPATFTVEQVVQIIAIACEKPSLSGRTVSHWTPRELADEVIKRGIVKQISVRTALANFIRGRFET